MKEITENIRDLDNKILTTGHNVLRALNNCIKDFDSEDQKRIKRIFANGFEKLEEEAQNLKELQDRIKNRKEESKNKVSLILNK